ncbi:hypothetical protein C0J52_24626 [Blattella germanica]|nr:hypothetical protein C0J52_24626 [Blattella germanica]
MLNEQSGASVNTTVNKAKVRTVQRTFLLKDILIEEYGSGYVRGNKDTISCVLCATEIKVLERRLIETHCNTIKHKKHINLLPNKGQPSELSSSSYSLSNKRSEVFRDTYV